MRLGVVAGVVAAVGVAVVVVVEEVRDCECIEEGVSKALCVAKSDDIGTGRTGVDMTSFGLFSFALATSRL